MWDCTDLNCTQKSVTSLLPNIFYSLFFLAFRSASSQIYEDDIKPQSLGLIISKS